MITYSEIRQTRSLRDFRKRFLVDYICVPLSPFFSLFFLKHKISPNGITLLMIISGVVGAVLFTLPFLIAKLVGWLLFYVWYTLDCSDGEVARISKNFSKYGKEMDYMAHLISHPLMNLGLFISYVQLNKYNLYFLSLVFILFISVELASRIIVMFSEYCIKNDAGSEEGETKKISILKYILIQLSIYPNFIVFFPLFYFLDLLIGINSLWILIVWLGMHTLICLKQILNYLLIFYRS